MSENEFSVNEFIVREIGYPGAIKQEVVGELVRCKDCVNYRPDKAGNYCRTFGRLRMNDFFCAYGEKKIDAFVEAVKKFDVYTAEMYDDLFLCDPEKNTKCRKTECYINGGECHLTSQKECRLRKRSGE